MKDKSDLFLSAEGQAQRSDNEKLHKSIRSFSYHRIPNTYICRHIPYMPLKGALKMSLIQVGITALRGPKGEFLPSVPLMREIPDTDEEIKVISDAELEELFINRMKKYADACNAIKKRGRQNA